jgi:hypothetical protein
MMLSPPKWEVTAHAATIKLTKYLNIYMLQSGNPVPTETTPKPRTASTKQRLPQVDNRSNCYETPKLNTTRRIAARKDIEQSDQQLTS